MVDASLPQDDSCDLAELLEETRILLPGSEVLVAFLISLPFTSRFDALTDAQRVVYLATFLSAIVALICFVMPAAYHRLARPIRRRGAFKVLATRFLILGLVPLSMALVLASYLVTSLAYSSLVATIVASAVGALIASLWWLMPLLRVHGRCDSEEAPPAGGRVDGAIAGTRAGASS